MNSGVGRATVLSKRLVVLFAAVLLVAGCGKGDAESSVTTVGELGAALAETAEVSTYRVSLSTAQTIRLPFGAVETTAEIDEQAPTMVGEVSSARQHFVMDLGALLGPILGEELDLQLEMWIDDERLVIDTRSYQQLLDGNPDAQLGPFEPGISYVDLADLEAEGPEMLAAFGGSALPDLRELAEKLPAALISVERTSLDPTTFVGTITFTDLSEAQGQDIEVISRSAAAGIALNSAMTVDALTKFYIDFYDSTEVEVTIELDGRGLLHVLTTRADLSNLYSAMFETEGLIPEITESERQEALDEVAGAVHTIETRAVYEADSDLEVPLPPATTDDRTDLWHEFFVNSGFG